MSEVNFIRRSQRVEKPHRCAFDRGVIRERVLSFGLTMAVNRSVVAPSTGVASNAVARNVKRFAYHADGQVGISLTGESASIDQEAIKTLRVRNEDIKKRTLKSGHSLSEHCTC